MLRTLGRLPTPVFRLLHVHCFSQDEVRASTLLYRHLLPALQERLLARDATLVHAAAVGSRDGRALLVCGRGGAGKTSGSAALYLERPERWRFLSDDFAIVGADGIVHPSPIPLNVFPYSITQFPPLAAWTVDRMDGLERLQWEVRGRLPGGKGAARRIPPPVSLRAPSSDAGPPPPGDASPTERSGGAAEPPQSLLDLCVFLERADGEGVTVEPWSPEALARECGTVLAHELRLSRRLYGSGGEGSEPDDATRLPSIGELAAASERVLLRALAGRRIRRIAVHEMCPGHEVADALESAWLGKEPPGGT